MLKPIFFISTFTTLAFAETHTQVITTPAGEERITDVESCRQQSDEKTSFPASGPYGVDGMNMDILQTGCENPKTTLTAYINISKFPENNETLEKLIQDFYKRLSNPAAVVSSSFNAKDVENKTPWPKTGAIQANLNLSKENAKDETKKLITALKETFGLSDENLKPFEVFLERALPGEKK